MRACVICGKHGVMQRYSGKEIADAQAVFMFIMEERVSDSIHFYYHVCKKCATKYEIRKVKRHA